MAILTYLFTKSVKRYKAIPNKHVLSFSYKGWLEFNCARCGTLSLDSLAEYSIDNNDINDSIYVCITCSGSVAKQIIYGISVKIADEYFKMATAPGRYCAMIWIKCSVDIRQGEPYVAIRIVAKHIMASITSEITYGKFIFCEMVFNNNNNNPLPSLH